MSWAALPFWVYMVEYEEHEAKMLCAFQEEVNSGFMKSLPKYVAKMIQEGRNSCPYENYRV